MTEIDEHSDPEFIAMKDNMIDTLKQVRGT